MTERPTMLAVLAQMTEAIAMRSTCKRAAIGAIIYDDRGVILSGGYNGALAGMPHCNHSCDCGANTLSPVPELRVHTNDCMTHTACYVSMHAEANAIIWAARRGVATEGHNILVSQSPCYRCAQLIVQCGIKSVRYVAEYRDKAGIGLLLDAGVTVSPIV